VSLTEIIYMVRNPVLEEKITPWFIARALFIPGTKNCTGIDFG
jgi:hypothetical protein